MGQFDNWQGRIIWSADVTWVELQEILQRDDFPRDEVAVKLDRLFLTDFGLDKIAAVQKMGVPVFADAKIVEIPVKTMELVKRHLEYRPWMLNVMAQITNTGVYEGVLSDGPIISGKKLDVLNEFSAACAEVGTKSCAVTVLTSKTANLVDYEYGGETRQVVCDYANLVAACGVTDLVCSPLEAQFLRDNSALADKLSLNTPGIRLSGESKNDQARVMSPGEALHNGADRLVIGRSLTEGGGFAENLQKIMTDIEKWGK